MGGESFEKKSKDEVEIITNFGRRGLGSFIFLHHKRSP